MFCNEEKFKYALLSFDSTIKAGMESLNRSSLGIIIAIREDNFFGTVTDGDIRRALIKGFSLEDSIEEVINRNAKVIRLSETKSINEIIDTAKELMRKYGIREIPIINDENKPIDVITWKDISLEEKRVYSTIPNIAFILAGGLGTRLDPFTKILPKPMIPIGDTPILELIMKKLYNYGFRNFIISVNYKKEIIKNYFNSEEFFERDINISFIEEEKRLGTAGSLSLLKQEFRRDTILVLNGDVILDVDYRKALVHHKRNKNHITIFAVPQSVRIPYGVLELNNGYLKRIKEKPEINVLINAGVYYIEPEVLELIPKNEYIDMPDVFEKAKNSGLKVSAYPVYGNYFDIGQWEEYRKTLKHFENFREK